MQKTVTIIDTFGFFFRSFYALPPLTNKDGFPTGLLTGFLNLVASTEKEFKSDYIIFALDSKGPTFRNDIDPEYKAHREAPPEDLLKQLPIAVEWIEKMGFVSMGETGFEADDIIATVARIAADEGHLVHVISHDKDLYQLIDDDRIVVIDAIKRKKKNEEACFDKYGVYPKQFVDYQSLLGDTADNVPGVKGIGKVTAEKLLKAHKTLDAMYDDLEAVEPPRIRALLEKHKADAVRSRQLVSLRTDVYESLDFDRLVPPEHPLLKIVPELYQYEMNAQLRLLKALKLRECKKLENSYLLLEYDVINDTVIE